MLTDFGRNSFITHTTGLKERIQKAEKENQMRPYRAIPIDGKDFIYGWYFQRAGASFIIPISEEYHTPASFVLTFVQVISETVSQQIGFEDKNKKTIYKGDFCKFSDWKPKKIIWIDGRYMLGDTLVICCEMECERMEIIGTIHTHPELMEKENA